MSFKLRRTGKIVFKEAYISVYAKFQATDVKDFSLFKLSRRLKTHLNFDGRENLQEQIT